MFVKRVLSSLVVIVGLLALQATNAAAKDYADVARNIVPSGQYGGFPVPPGGSEQAEMYDGLTPLFDQVTNPDLNSFFKSEVFNSVGPDGPTTVEEVPREGVTVVRDRFYVPHVTGDTKDDGIWAAGYLLAEDRALLLAQARFNARVAAVDVPGLTAIGLIEGLKNFEPSAKTERVVAKQTNVLNSAGKEGKAVLHDIDVFIKGINAYLEANSPDTEPWTRNDIYALNALKGQFLGEGGGEEAERSQFLDGLQSRLGGGKGMKVFNDLRQFRNQDAPTTVDGQFKYGKIPSTPTPGSVVIDDGSYTPDPAIANSQKAENLSTEAINASNTLQINADRSDKGVPLMVGGPQIGYFYPGFTYEIDMNAGKLKWRGVTSAPFPGYLLIGRSEDFAVTLTSASADIIDQYVETLCEGSDTKYVYKGKCMDMKNFNAGTLDGEKVEFMTTKHGPVVAYATVDGRRVAISERRSSYGRDVRDQLFFRRLSLVGKVDSPKSFYKAANKTPQTFNSFYIDNTDNAMFTSGRLPKRPQGTDPGLPTDGRGDYEWQGYEGKKTHPRGKNPKGGAMVNWNNNVAKGFGAADDQWGRSGSAARVDLLNRNLRKLDKGGRWDLLAVTSAMNAAATQDVRAIRTVPLLARLLNGTTPPNPQAAQMLAVIKDWRVQGGSRLDKNLDGRIDHPGAASMDGAWDLIADAFMRPRIGSQLDQLDSFFSRFDSPPGGQYSGWYQYFERDIKRLLGQEIKAPFKITYCGKGDLERCQDAVWAAIAQAGKQLEQQQGNANPANWFADADAERISFAPGLLPTTMRYTNRPSGIQQVISFTGSR